VFGLKAKSLFDYKNTKFPSRKLKHGLAEKGNLPEIHRTPNLSLQLIWPFYASTIANI